MYEGEGGRGMDEKLGVSKLDEGSFENRKKKTEETIQSPMAMYLRFYWLIYFMLGEAECLV